MKESNLSIPEHINNDLTVKLDHYNVHASRRKSLGKKMMHGIQWLTTDQPTCNRCKDSHIDYFQIEKQPGTKCLKCGNMTVQSIRPLARLLPHGLKMEFIGNSKNLTQPNHKSIQFTKKLNNFRKHIQKRFGEGSYSTKYLVSDKIPSNLLTDIPPTSKQISRQILLNRSNQQYLPLKIDQSTIKGAGQGVFTTQKLQCDKIIVSYIGQVILAGQFWPPSDSLYGVGWFHEESTPQFVVVEPIRSLNVGRFINSTIQDKCNCAIGKCLVNGQFTLYIYSTRQIKKGQQLFYFYGRDYTKSTQFDPSVNNQLTELKPGQQSGRKVVLQKMQEQYQQENEFVMDEQRIDEIQIKQQINTPVPQKRRRQQTLLIVQQELNKVLQIFYENYDNFVMKLNHKFQMLMKRNEMSIWNPFFLQEFCMNSMRTDFTVTGQPADLKWQHMQSNDTLDHQKKELMFHYIRESQNLLPQHFWGGFQSENRDNSNKLLLHKELFIIKQRMLFMSTYHQDQIVSKLAEIVDEDDQQQSLIKLLTLLSINQRSSNKMLISIDYWLKQLKLRPFGLKWEMYHQTKINLSLKELISRIASYKQTKSDEQVLQESQNISRRCVQEMGQVTDKAIFQQKEKVKTKTQILSKSHVLNKNQLSSTYRQFSRQKYVKYKHQFPRMNESELVAKLVKQWEALSSEQTKELLAHYLSENFLQKKGSRYSPPTPPRIRSPGSSQQGSIRSTSEKSNSHMLTRKAKAKESLYRQQSLPIKTSGVRVFIRQSQSQFSEQSDYARSCDKRIQIIDEKEQKKQTKLVIKKGHIQNQDDFGEPHCQEKLDEKNTMAIETFMFFTRIKKIINEAKSAISMNHDSASNFLCLREEYKQACKGQIKYDIKQFFTSVSIKSRNSKQMCQKSKCKLCEETTVIKKQTNHFVQHHSTIYWAQQMLSYLRYPYFYIFTISELSNSTCPLQQTVFLVTPSRQTVKKANQKCEKRQNKVQTVRQYRVSKENIKMINQWFPKDDECDEQEDKQQKKKEKRVKCKQIAKKPPVQKEIEKKRFTVIKKERVRLKRQIFHQINKK